MPNFNSYILRAMALVTISFSLSYGQDVLLNVFPGTSIIYYPIVGESSFELRKQLNEKGPVDDQTNQSVDAFTKWEIVCSWPVRKDNVADLSKATVTLKAVVTLPKWIPSNDLDNTLIAKWNAYLEKLIDHEARHLRLALECRDEIKNVIKKSSSTTVNANIKVILEKFRAAELEFDIKTDHGKRDGVIFP